MSHHFFRCMQALIAIGLVATLSACEGVPDSLTSASLTYEDHAAFAHVPSAETSPEVLQWLAGLRATIASYHRFEVARDAGYETEITPCMELAGTGGMGFHYGDVSLINGTVEEFKPELLLYEPQKNGTLRLVAVEYIVPFTAWTEASPPVLHGLTFMANETFQVWALHVWAFQHNPAGIFADWNPTISCAYAP